MVYHTQLEVADTCHCPGPGPGDVRLVNTCDNSSVTACTGQQYLW